jgi:5'-3' exoribonuclease 1
LDIVFDVSFMSGTSLGDRCSPFRGSTVPTWSVLNLSHRQLVAVSKAAAIRQSKVNHSSPLTVPGYGAPGINGRGQLTEARTPPPLRGSWRGAVAGQSPSMRASPGGNGYMSRGRGHHNGSGGASAANLPFRQPVNGGQGVNPNGFVPRGRAGLGSSQGSARGGYTPIDRGDNQAGVVDNNPHFKPQAHHNVPPPTSLDNGPRGRGRGRGSGRGRSERGRGIRGSGRSDGQRGQGNAVQ